MDPLLSKLKSPVRPTQNTKAERVTWEVSFVAKFADGDLLEDEVDVLGTEDGFTAVYKLRDLVLSEKYLGEDAKPAIAFELRGCKCLAKATL